MSAAPLAALLVALVVAGPGRLLAADGALDPFFDGDGTTKLGYSPGTTQEDGRDVAVLGSGRILVGGSTTASDPALGGAEMNVFGLRRDGTLDTGFGLLGARRLGTPAGDYGRSLAIQRGKILVAGQTEGADGPDFLVCRLKRSGAVDPTFGARGCRRIVLTDAWDPHLAVRGDGAIVLAGRSGAGADMTVVRLTPQGRIDRSFGDHGVATFDLGDFELVFAVALQSDGRILVAGSTDLGGARQFAVLRLRPGGTLDPAFATGGVFTFHVFGDLDEAHGIAVQPDGKIVVAGEAYVTAFGDYDMAVLRLDAAGIPDPTFGTDGLAIRNFGVDSNDNAADVLVLPDGRIVAGGTSSPLLGDEDFALAWWNPDGTPDAAVGLGGLVMTDVEGEGSFDMGRALALQRDGKLLLAGMTESSGQDAAVARYIVDLPWNGGFERSYAAPGKADLWGLRGTRAADGRDCTGAHAGSCSLKLTARRPARGVKLAEQWTGAAGKAGDAWDASAWCLAEGASGPGALQVRVTFAYRDGTRETFRLAPDPALAGWQEVARTVTAARPYRNVKVSLVYGKTTGSVRFDDLLLAPRQ